LRRKLVGRDAAQGYFRLVVTFRSAEFDLPSFIFQAISLALGFAELIDGFI
jgi:hypothetical protein